MSSYGFFVNNDDGMKLQGVFLSFFELMFRVVLAPRAKVLFYYPQHFNRSAEGTNPFFDPMLETCRRHDISYKLIEEPDWGTDKPRNGGAIKGDAFFVLVLVLRKIAGKSHPANSFEQNERLVANWLNILTFGRFRYDRYISISGSMEGLFLHLNRRGEVFEVQHGVDYSNKTSYFRNGEVYEAYRSERWHLLSFGEGYRECVIKWHENEMADRVHVLGCPIDFSQNQKRSMTTDGRKSIIFSLQFTHDWTADQMMYAKNLLVHTLEQLAECGCSVLLKHHPRYNNCISIDDVYWRFPFVSETQESLFELQFRAFLHVTMCSTTAFEFAAAGVSTYFMRNENFPKENSIFYREYRYPLFWDMSIEESVSYLRTGDNIEKASLVAEEWYSRFYSPYNEEVFLRLISR